MCVFFIHNSTGLISAGLDTQSILQQRYLPHHSSQPPLVIHPQLDWSDLWSRHPIRPQQRYLPHHSSQPPLTVRRATFQPCSARTEASGERPRAPPRRARRRKREELGYVDDVLCGPVYRLSAIAIGYRLVQPPVPVQCALLISI